MARQIIQQERAFQTYKKIIASTVELMGTQPLESIKVKDICEHAGVSIGSFYHYFSAKEDILSAVYAEREAEVQREWEQQNFLSPIDALQFLVMSQLLGITRKGPVFATQFFRYHLTPAEGRSMLQDNGFFYRKINEEVEKLIERSGADISSHMVTHDILRACRGVLYDWCMRGGNYNHILVGFRYLDMVLKYYGLHNSKDSSDLDLILKDNPQM